MNNKLLRVLLGLLLGVGMSSHAFSQLVQKEGGAQDTQPDAVQEIEQTEEASDDNASQAQASLSPVSQHVHPCADAIKQLHLLVHGLDATSRSIAGPTGRSIHLWLLQTRQRAYAQTHYTWLKPDYSIDTMKRAAVSMIDDIVSFQDSEDAESCTPEERQRLEALFQKADSLSQEFRHAEESYLANSVLGGVITGLVAVIAAQYAFLKYRLSRLSAARHGHVHAQAHPVHPPLGVPPPPPRMTQAERQAIIDAAVGAPNRPSAAAAGVDGVVLHLNGIPAGQRQTLIDTGTTNAPTKVVAATQAVDAAIAQFGIVVTP